MRRGHCLWAAALLCAAATPAFAVEGTAAAGPIGGTDIRQALLPPPGIYGGGVAFDAPVRQFFDGHGALIPALSETRIVLAGVAPFLAWVPDIQVLGGSIGIGGIVSLGSECGRLFAATPRRCINGAGDPYVEVAWSRYFGTPRASQYPGAFPIPEGLTLQLAFGTVIPVGSYDATIARSNGVTLGNNIWDFAPIIAATYVTRPILAEGTEISAKLYWNNYLANPATHYSTGALLNVDFAVTERIGRFQAGLAGFYSFQVADDMSFDVPVAPDGRRLRLLDLGGVVAYDMPEIAASMKLKVVSTVITQNSPAGYGIAFSVIKKLH
jgi:hypothetical protein